MTSSSGPLRRAGGGGTSAPQPKLRATFSRRGRSSFVAHRPASTFVLRARPLVRGGPSAASHSARSRQRAMTPAAVGAQDRSDMRSDAHQPPRFRPRCRPRRSPAANRWDWPAHPIGRRSAVLADVAEQDAAAGLQLVEHGLVGVVAALAWRPERASGRGCRAGERRVEPFGLDVDQTPAKRSERFLSSAPNQTGLARTWKPLQMPRTRRRRRRIP